MGHWAERASTTADAQVSKKEALEIKREAESHGMVNWMMNVRSTQGQCSCSCCGCCCHAMRGVNEFNAPGFDCRRRISCRSSMRRDAPIAASARRVARWGRSSSIRSRRSTRILQERCIGCGLCVLACDRQRAPGDGAGARLQAAVPQLVFADCARPPGMLMTNWKVAKQGVRRSP